jgi:hypothetical protein
MPRWVLSPPRHVLPRREVLPGSRFVPRLRLRRSGRLLPRHEEVRRRHMHPERRLLLRHPAPRLPGRLPPAPLRGRARGVRGPAAGRLLPEQRRAGGDLLQGPVRPYRDRLSPLPVAQVQPGHLRLRVHGRRDRRRWGRLLPGGLPVHGRLRNLLRWSRWFCLPDGVEFLLVPHRQRTHHVLLPSRPPLAGARIRDHPLTMSPESSSEVMPCCTPLYCAGLLTRSPS